MVSALSHFHSTSARWQVTARGRGYTMKPPMKQNRNSCFARPTSFSVDRHWFGRRWSGRRFRPVIKNFHSIYAPPFNCTLSRLSFTSDAGSCVAFAREYERVVWRVCEAAMCEAAMSHATELEVQCRCHRATISPFVRSFRNVTLTDARYNARHASQCVLRYRSARGVVPHHATTAKHRQVSAQALLRAKREPLAIIFGSIVPLLLQWVAAKRFNQ